MDLAYPDFPLRRKHGFTCPEQTRVMIKTLSRSRSLLTWLLVVICGLLATEYLQAQEHAGYDICPSPRHPHRVFNGVEFSPGKRIDATDCVLPSGSSAFMLKASTGLF